MEQLFFAAAPSVVILFCFSELSGVSDLQILRQLMPEHEAGIRGKIPYLQISAEFLPPPDLFTEFIGVNAAGGLDRVPQLSDFIGELGNAIHRRKELEVGLFLWLIAVDQCPYHARFFEADHLSFALPVGGLLLC